MLHLETAIFHADNLDLFFQIEVDGQAAGATPPMSRLSLAEGAHTITVRNADFAPYTVQVQVSADKPVTIRHRFGS